MPYVSWTLQESTMQLSDAITRTVKMREDSWNPKTKNYELTLEGAAHEATLQAGLDVEMSTVVFLLLNESWNDALEWAQEVVNADVANRRS